MANVMPVAIRILWFGFLFFFINSFLAVSCTEHFKKNEVNLTSII